MCRQCSTDIAAFLESNKSHNNFWKAITWKYTNVHNWFLSLWTRRSLPFLYAVLGYFCFILVFMFLSPHQNFSGVNPTSLFEMSIKQKEKFFFCLLFYPKFQACNFAPLLRNLEVTLFECYVYLESCWGQLDGTLGLANPLRKWKFHSSKPLTHFNSTVKYFNPLVGFSRTANGIFTVLWATNSEGFTVPTEEKGPHNHPNTKFLNSYQTSPIINQCTLPDGG